MVATLNVESKVPFMTVSSWQLNRFERFLFRAALVLAGVVVIVRIAAMLLLTVLHHAWWSRP